MRRFVELESLVAVVEAGSFTAAAERLGIGKSVVSRRVAALEGRLGVQLLARTTRRLNLTDSGRSFYVHCARVLADLEEAESAVAQLHGELRGRLKVALPLSFGRRHMPDPIAEFGRRHPQLAFDLDLNDRRIDLVEEGMDLAIRIGRLRDSTLIARKLFDARTVVCAAPGYLDAHGVPRTPDELSDHVCLVYSNLTDPYRWVCTGADGTRHSIDIRHRMTISNGDFLCEAAARNLGIVLQPTFIAHEHVRQGLLVPILTDYAWPVTPAYAVYPPTRHLSYRVREFIDFLVEHFTGKPSWDLDCERVAAG
ncbi:MAG: LysR family transcriptional regulator [Gammaproteobacteria bacterium]|nr:LysR family transcriptional regulator [Gammaproteobacteria bacterium]MDH5309624.1 LysR family transcriptional regulator [Gammaproteobacteria bacterium]